MTEAEWLAGTDCRAMLYSLVGPSGRRLTLFCTASGWMGGPVDPATRDAWYEMAEDVFEGRKPFTAFVRLFWENYEQFPRFRPTPEHLVDVLVGVRLPHHPANPPDADRIRCIFGNPFRRVKLNPSWLTSTVVRLAAGIYADRAFDRLPILADALQDAGCENPDVLAHCRGDGPHVRGCWVVDLVLGKS